MRKKSIIGSGIIILGVWRLDQGLDQFYSYSENISKHVHWILLRYPIYILTKINGTKPMAMSENTVSGILEIGEGLICLHLVLALNSSMFENMFLRILTKMTQNMGFQIQFSKIPFSKFFGKFFVNFCLI